MLGLLTCLLAATSLVQASASEPKIWLEAAISPSVGYVGQRRQLVLTVFTDSWFSAANEFPYLTVERAISQQPEAFATNYSVRRHGVRYAAQRRTYNIYPSASGQLLTPPLRVIAKVAATDPITGLSTTQAQALYAPPQVFTVMPWSAAPQPRVFASSLHLSNRFDRDLGQLQVGDIVQRDIRIEARGTAAVLLPTIDVRPQSGLMPYLLPPQFNDDSNRGDIVARSQQVVRYKVERGDVYTLPAIALPWWNVDTQTLEIARLPAVTLTAAGSQGMDGAATIALAVIAALVLSYWLVPWFIVRVSTGEQRLFWQLWWARDLSAEAFLGRYYRWRQEFYKHYAHWPLTTCVLRAQVQQHYDQTAISPPVSRHQLRRALWQARRCSINAAV